MVCLIIPCRPFLKHRGWFFGHSVCNTIRLRLHARLLMNKPSKLWHKMPFRAFYVLAPLIASAQGEDKRMTVNKFFERKKHEKSM